MNCTALQSRKLSLSNYLKLFETRTEQLFETRTKADLQHQLSSQYMTYSRKFIFSRKLSFGKTRVKFSLKSEKVKNDALNSTKLLSSLEFFT